MSPVNRAELVEMMSAEYEGNKAEAAKALDAAVRAITYELAAGGKVSIAGFGIFEAVARPARVVRDPDTGKQRTIKSPPAPQFRAGAELKAYTSGVKKPPKRSRTPVLSRRAAAAKVARLIDGRSGDNLIRHIAEFDPKQPDQYLFAAPPASDQAAALAALAHPPTIPWPEGVAPTPVRREPRPTTTTPLPRADVLIVAYHTAEGHALADVLTPGWGLNRWYRYRNGWRNLKKAVQAGAPSLVRDQAGSWATTRMGDTTAVLVKSDLHPCLDGDQLPVQALLSQMLDQVEPRLVITTGSAGGLGPDVATGDVIVSRHVRQHATAGSGDYSRAGQSYSSTARLRASQFTFAAQHLLPAAADDVSTDRPRRLFIDTSRQRVSVITTDVLATAADRAGLLPHLSSAKAVDMADAMLGLVCAERSNPPGWVSVRTTHDAQTDVPEQDEGRREAASAYEQTAYMASVSSAIICWSLVTQP